jgi:hypothetical protein
MTHRPNGCTSVASNFLIKVSTSGLGGCRLDGWSSTRNFHICWARVQTMIGRRPDGWSWIRNFHICWTRVRTILTDFRTVVFELWFLPYEWARPDGNPRRPDGWINLPKFELGKKIWSWSITGSRPDRLLSRMDGCKLEQKLLDSGKVQMGIHVVRTNDALVCWASERYGTSFGRMGLWTAGRPDRMTRRPDGWQGTEIFWLVSSAKSSEGTLNSGIPVTKHLYI